ncbi:MAG: histidinol-phosphate transaminase [Gammaproteobacteria bacterium]|nr:histidinol-phosphate transaminase [Gammaproteobacteria bacterium]MCW9003957.1 histidinol-phosphate transaminase [Gammaproteobacteria bacterium]
MNQFLKYAVPGVQQLTPYLPGKPVEELERELGITNAIKLASNENPLGPSQKAVVAAQAILNKVNFYPDGSSHELRQSLAAKHGVAIDSISIGNGSNDILELIARTFLAPGYSAVFSEYSFAVYPIIVQAVGADARIAKAFSADDPVMPYGHDLDELLSQLDQQTRVVFIANPNNPTGTWLERERLSDFLENVANNIIVVLDEAYYEYMPEDLKPDSEALIKRFPNLIITRTFSKIYGLAGLRIGYSISHPDVADLLNRVRQPFNVNLLAQTAALAALDDDQHLLTSIAMNNSGLQQLANGFNALGLGFIPSIANFITVNLDRAATPVYEALLREGVIVRPVANYCLPNHLRITVGTEEQNRRVLDALERCIND